MKNRVFTKAMSAAICLPLAMTAFVGCSDDEVNNNQNGENIPSKEIVGGERLSLASLTQEKKSNISARTNGFSWEMLSEVAKQKGNTKNTFLSPLSLAIDLGMLQNGANGDTYTEIVNSIGLQDYSSSEVNSYFSSIISDLQKADPTVDLNVANIIYYNNNLVSALNPDFTKFITTSYEAPVKGGAMDQSTVDEVNQWCNEQTKGTIPNIIDRFSNNCIIALLNAIYLKGDFTNKLMQTIGKQYFQNGEDKDVFQYGITAMRKMSYFENSDLQYCEIPLGNKAFNVFFVLPKEGKNAVGTAGNLASNWDKMIQNLSDTLVDFTAPQFKTELEIKGDTMRRAMGALGITTMFDEKMADLRGLLTPKDLSPDILNLYVGNVAQKTHFEISPEGVKASAATIIEVVEKVISPEPVVIPEHVVMNVNHPFVFGIREASTGTILFNGICNDPTLMEIDNKNELSNIPF